MSHPANQKKISEGNSSSPMLLGLGGEEECPEHCSGRAAQLSPLPCALQCPLEDQAGHTQQPTNLWKHSNASGGLLSKTSGFLKVLLEGLPKALEWRALLQILISAGLVLARGQGTDSLQILRANGMALSKQLQGERS